MTKATFINGSYRRGGVTDTILDEIAGRFADRGFEVVSHRLRDLNMRFCTNCRTCCLESGPTRGRCVIDDDAGRVFNDVDAADWLVLGSPVNEFTVTALMKLLAERTIAYVYWPWGMTMPKPRISKPTRSAVLVNSTAMPASMARFFTRGMRDMRNMARVTGFKPALEYRAGMVAMAPEWSMPPKLRDRIARDIGRIAA